MSQRPQRIRGDDEDRPPPTTGIAGSEPRYDAALEGRIATMREALRQMRPGSDAEALRILRAAFPSSTLSERVAALAAQPDAGP